MVAGLAVWLLALVGPTAPVPLPSPDVADAYLARRDKAVHLEAGECRYRGEWVPVARVFEAYADARLRETSLREHARPLDGLLRANRDRIARLQAQWRAADHRLRSRLETVEADLRHAENVIDTGARGPELLAPPGAPAEGAGAAAVANCERRRAFVQAEIASVVAARAAPQATAAADAAPGSD